jgi:hypothetical protein
VVDISQLDTAGALEIDVVLMSILSAHENDDAYDVAWRMSDQHVAPKVVRNVEGWCRNVTHEVACEMYRLGGG